MLILWFLLVLIIRLGGLAFIVLLGGRKWICYLPEKLILLGQTRILSGAWFLCCLYGLSRNVEISIVVFLIR